MAERINGTIAGVSLLAAAETLHAYSAMLPPHHLVRATPAGGGAAAANVRSGYSHALLLGVLIGGAAALLVRHPLPLLLSGATAAVMTQSYEAALAAPPMPALKGAEGWPDSI